MKKLYYRLGELQDRYGISTYDIRYLLEREQLPLCFYRPQRTFITGRENNFQFIAFGYVAYFGLVEIAQEYGGDLLEYGQAESKYCLLLERDNLESLGVL